MNNQSRPAKPLLLAHRGTALLAPENTVPAFDFAVAHEADVLEIDVRISRDNQVMVFHDETLDRTTNGSGPLRALDVTALQQLDAAFNFTLRNQRPDRGTGIQILTLTELLERYPDIRVNIDIKDADRQAVVATGDAVVRSGAVDRCVLASFHVDQVKRCRLLFPELKCALSLADIKNYYLRFLCGKLRGHSHSAGLFQVPVSHYGIPLAGRRFIESIHRGGGEINFWTINDTQQMKRLLERGADGIVTDRADLANDVISSIAMDRKSMLEEWSKE